MNVINQDGSEVAQTVGARKVDVSRGSHNGAVSSQWFKRPDDERFTDMNSLMDMLRERNIGTREDNMMSEDFRLIAQPHDPDTLEIIAPDRQPASPTNIAFRQMCGLVKAPYDYLSGLPATIAGMNLQYGFNAVRDLGQKCYWNEKTREIRAFTGEGYGRVMDLSLAEAVHRIAGNGRGDTRWKVPGRLDWSTMMYDPNSAVTKQSTTLYASDRDVFLFLVDDTHPIEVGKLKDGSPDYVFRGFYAWNSEVGTRSIGVATFLMRASCDNRILWGVEGFEEIKARHSRFAPMRFAREIEPSLLRYSEAATSGLVTGIRTAQEVKVASNEEEQREFLGRRGFTKHQTEAVLQAVLLEEGKPAESIWDMVQGITAVARGVSNTDTRLDLERTAGKLMKDAVGGRRR